VVYDQDAIEMIKLVLESARRLASQRLAERQAKHVLRRDLDHLIT